MARRRTQPGLDDLFSAAVSPDERLALGVYEWPEPARFPLNEASNRVGNQVVGDLVGSTRPLVVAGYSSIGELTDLAARWSRSEAAADPDARLRVLFGAEPFAAPRVRFGDARRAFTDEVHRYWLEERGVSILQSAALVATLQQLEAGRVDARFLRRPGSWLHAKVYVGDEAATVGSSNFTAAGLRSQLEANARFDRADDAERYDEARRIAENYWSTGADWRNELIALLEAMLAVVGWREALARACAELLEGAWADRYLRDVSAGAGSDLWPSQQIGIAQALWIIERVGSVLVADATGSGKTRMGAHLVRAIRDRLWATGRVRTDRNALVCPPAVIDTWEHEIHQCGLAITTVSHGKLSRSGVGRVSAPAERVSREELLVSETQILAIDEAHHYLNPGSARTQQVRGTQADHVALFTATPINRGPSDLLQLVALLGADNFADETIELLLRLQRRRARSAPVALEGTEVELLRREIQRFTVRRTKATLNELVDEHPDDYRHPVSDRVCRYPEHRSEVYDTGETEQDAEIARQVRVEVDGLLGLTHLESRIAVPAGLRSIYSDAQWLDVRLRSIRGLAGHQVLASMRSSAAAAVEHLAGTGAAVERFGVDLGRLKQTSSGDVIGALRNRAGTSTPALDLDCEVPAWLADQAAWAAACEEEAARYERILALIVRLSPARERTKAAMLGELAARHRLVLAFDRHPITLAVIADQLGADPSASEVLDGTAVMLATSEPSTRRKVAAAFGRDSTQRAVALCSDALNEGLNLQGASAVVHLDLPTTLRVVEQRIGRVDRMDSPHDLIEVWWPGDGPDFATRANEHLARRAADSEELLGSNLPVPPEIVGASPAIDVAEEIREAERADPQQWDGIRDALDPVRRLVSGDDGLVDRATYRHFRDAGGRVLARVSPVVATEPWLFVAVGGSDRSAPRWMLVEGLHREPVCDLEAVADGLRRLLRGDPPARELDADATDVMAELLARAEQHEVLLLPRRHQRALDQLERLTTRWADVADRAGGFELRERWRRIGQLADPRSTDRADPHQVAERWLRFVAPRLDDHRRASRRPLVLLRDIEPALRDDPPEVAAVEECFAGLVPLAPMAERVSACIVGVPAV